MNPIPPAQVVIVDDMVVKEAVPLLKALSSRGISAAYFSGRVKELPNTPLEGVRLLFLDLRLGLAGTTTRSNVAAVAAVAAKIISHTNGPYILVGWTKHPGEMDDLLPILKPKPTVFIPLDKIGCIKRGTCDLQLVINEITTKINSRGPIELLLFWERLVALASCATINQICDLIPADAPDDSYLEGILHEIARANLGQHLASVSPEQLAKSDQIKPFF